MTDDDDLPVLTQVLRVGAGRRGDDDAGASIDEADTILELRSPDETLMADQLVIGNEAHQDLEPYLPRSDDGGRSAANDGLAAAPEPEVDFDRLAAQVQDAVLVDLSARIDTELDARIAQSLHAEIESAVASLQANLRAHLSDALRDVVRRAVDDEVARLRGTRS